ncbi:hypothetical protein EJ02DRAFT_222845 [Clathrospora elynae]|uniref:Uncharacterized protein n=1 Tax=Clathrospora elynae TaxID=706981 RepID=A0A6A5SMN2_9PLEO|nr:hypothetical protein EJ02DRAFT_222845 [Clathrospora elynae]
MASPQESITTVNGKRCTRSRARTAATSTLTTSETSVVAPTEATTSTAVEALPVQTSTTEVSSTSPPPPPPPPPSSTTPAEQPVVAPTTSTTEAAATSAIAAPTSLVASPSSPPSSTAPAVSNTPTSAATNPEQPTQSNTEAQPASTDIPGTEAPLGTTSIFGAIPTGSSAGIIAPNQGPEDSGLTLPTSGESNIGGILGGVFGGIAALALISGLLFFCLRRKRNSRSVRWDEKGAMRAIGAGFTEKIKSISAGVAGFMAKLKGKKAGPMGNLYQRHTAQGSVSSMYSTNTNGRGRPTSEPQALSVGRRTGSPSNKKGERNLVHKKPSSISSNYRFPGIVGNNGSPNANPFTDPEPRNTLFLLNPDPRSAPVTPQIPAATAQAPQDPFASILDPEESADLVRGPGLTHQRTQSSHQPLSLYPANDPANDPFKDPRPAPPIPTQAVLPQHNRRSSMTLPTFDATSTATSGESNYIILPNGRRYRQSDPFDLDRPEVLGFGNVIGRKPVRGSVTRQVSRNKRTSSFGNWGGAADGPYARQSAKPDPPWGPNGKKI